MTDVAKEFGVSKETIRRDINRYRDDLVGHIEKTGRGFVLDEIAIDFLRKKRETLIVIDNNSDVRIRELIEENRQLYAKLLEVQNNLVELQKQKSDMEIKYLDQSHLIEAKNSQIEEAKKELDRFKPFIFGLYKKN